MEVRKIMTALTAASLLGSAGIVQANTCSEVLVSQVQHSEYSNEIELAWLSIIDHRNYRQAKQPAGAKYQDMFTGSAIATSHPSASATSSRRSSALLRMNLKRCLNPISPVSR